MDERPSGVAEVLSILYIALGVADLVIVADIVSGGELHRWGARRIRAMYRWAVEPLRREADMRRQAAWVIWEAMQLLEDATP